MANGTTTPEAPEYEVAAAPPVEPKRDYADQQTSFYHEPRPGPFRTFLVKQDGEIVNVHLGQGLTLDEVVKQESGAFACVEGEEGYDVAFFEGEQLRAIARLVGDRAGNYTLERFEDEAPAPAVRSITITNPEFTLDELIVELHEVHRWRVDDGDDVQEVAQQILVDGRHVATLTPDEFDDRLKVTVIEDGKVTVLDDDDEDEGPAPAEQAPAVPTYDVRIVGCEASASEVATLLRDTRQFRNADEAPIVTTDQLVYEDGELAVTIKTSEDRELQIFEHRNGKVYHRVRDRIGIYQGEVEYDAVPLTPVPYADRPERQPAPASAPQAPAEVDPADNGDGDDDDQDDDTIPVAELLRRVSVREVASALEHRRLAMQHLLMVYDDIMHVQRESEDDVDPEGDKRTLRLVNDVLDRATQWHECGTRRVALSVLRAGGRHDEAAGAKQGEAWSPAAVRFDGKIVAVAPFRANVDAHEEGYDLTSAIITEIPDGRVAELED